MTRAFAVRSPSDPSDVSEDLTSRGSSPPVPAGVIAGGVVGGVAVLAGFIALLYYFRRDSRRYRPPSSPGPTVPRPFTDVQSRSEAGLQQQASIPHPPSTPSGVSFSQSSSSGSGSHGSVEHRIRAANQRMRSLRAEMASVSGRTALSTDSSNSRTATSGARTVEELSEEVKQLRRELQALKQQQRQQAQVQLQSPPLEEPPPTYTPESIPHQT
jgi:hypothetical protein